MTAQPNPLEAVERLLSRDPLAAIASLDGSVKEPLVCLTVPERDLVISTLRSQAEALENMDHALEGCRAFIDRYSDVRDGDYGGVEPNEAMQLVHAIDQSRAALTPEVKS